MTTSNIYMNSSFDFLSSEIQQESSYASDFTENQIQKEESNKKYSHDENGPNNTKNQKSKPTRIKEKITIDAKEMFSGPDTNKDMPTFEGNKKYETTYSDERDGKDRKKAKSNPTNKQDQNTKQKHQTDHNFSPRDGEQTTGSCNQNKDDQTSGGGKKDKTDDNDKNRSHSSPSELMKNEIRRKAKDLSQNFISTLLSEMICSIIDEVMEKGFQDIDFSKDIRNSFWKAMKSLMYGCLTLMARYAVKLFGMKVQQAKYLADLGAPLLNLETAMDFASILKKLFNGKLTLTKAVIQIFLKAAFVGIGLLIEYQFGTVGYVTGILINTTLAVIQHLVNCFIWSLCVI